jgi:hypothetical protein
MADTIDMLGVATVIGAGPTAITGVSTLIASKSAFNRKAEKKVGKNEKGNTNRVAYMDHQKTLSVTFTPTGTSKTAVKTLAGATATLKPGVVVTLNDADDPDIAGKWIIDDFKKNKGSGDDLTFDLDLWQPEDTTICDNVIS